MTEQWMPQQGDKIEVRHYIECEWILAEFVCRLNSVGAGYVVKLDDGTYQQFRLARPIQPKEDEIKIWDVVSATVFEGIFVRSFHGIVVRCYRGSKEGEVSKFEVYDPDRVELITVSEHNLKKLPNKVAMAPASIKERSESLPSPSLKTFSSLKNAQDYFQCASFEDEPHRQTRVVRWPHSISLLTIEDVKS